MGGHDMPSGPPHGAPTAMVVEDDLALAKVLERVLDREGYSVMVYRTGPQALDGAAEHEFDLALVDVSLPPPDGLEVCRSLRRMGIQVPILMVSGRAGVNDRILGLEAGADDYLTKPFDVRELRARVRAIERRGRHTPGSTTLQAGDLRIDVGARTVRRGDATIDLTRREFDLLHAFMRRPGDVLSREQLRRAVWGYTREVDDRVVDVYVRYLRSKIDEPFGTSTIQTVRGSGYKFRPPDR